jgi:hypothetical protein
MATTPNYGLALPVDADPQDVAVLDANFNILDTVIKANDTYIKNEVEGAWVDVSANWTWGADTTNPVWGVGSIHVVRMLRQGKTRTVRGFTQVGSSGITQPSGTMKITNSLASDNPSATGQAVVGTAIVQDAVGPFAEFFCGFLYRGSGVWRLPLGSSAAGNRIVGNSPIATWAVGDQLIFNVTYEVD